MITHIYFDWSETLAKPKTREIFLFGKTLKDKLSVLYPDVLPTLMYLHNKGYKLGIISNTSKKRKDIIKALNDSGLIHFFNASIVFSSDPGMCKKGCDKIFEYVLKNDGISPKNAVMVGNNYVKDVIGGKQMNMGTVFVDRNRLNMKGVEDIKINNISDLIKYF